MALINKKITPEELAQRLVSSKKVMQKVDTGDYETGNINEQALISNEVEITADGEKPMQPPVDQPTKFKSIGTIDPNRINQSKLPDSIKKAMLENPIPQITLNDSLDIDLVKKAKKLMEQEGVQSKPSGKSPLPPKQTRDVGFPQIDESKLEKLVENAVRKVLDEKLTQILSAQQLQTINENLVLKVGDSIFQGKITKVKSAK